ncbi:MAG TPA: zinc ribbon domain-containing protein [Rudaea sp.]|jgi:putative FmdB family regulatory protein|uniref:FmdB family zinc ribbon protein n=1 Tax=Rudaea sp. TaxID=2136325 RepID=UPI002F93CCAD
MPIYEFECASCGTRFDRLQKLSDPDPSDCPQCGAARVHRRLTAPAFRLSGSGWYETDFKKQGDKKRNLTGSDDAPKAAPDTAPKSDGAAKRAADKPTATESAGAAKKATESAKPKGDSSSVNKQSR